MVLTEGFETDPALSQPSPARSSALSQAAFFSNRAESVLQLSSSEDLDVVGIDAGDIKDSPPHTPTYERVMEVVTCTVAKLNIDWPAEKQEVQKKSLLDKRFLPSRSQPPHWGLHFFPISTLRCQNREETEKLLRLRFFFQFY